MSKASKYLFITGLSIGLCIGLGILVVQKYIASQLVSLLEAEAEGSGAGSFQVDEISVSLLTLSAKAKNAQIVKDKQAVLSFDRINLEFGLEDLLSQKMIYLNSLDLIDGHSLGVGPKSSTFKFIDYLTAPLPPEKDKEDRYRLKLKGLRVINSSLEESGLQASGVGLVLSRTADDNFILKPEIKSLEFKEQQLGEFAAYLGLYEDEVRFKSISGNLRESKLNLTGNILNSDELNLKGNFGIDLKDLSREQLDAYLTGKTKISSNFSKTEITSEFQAKSPSTIRISGIKLPELEYLKGQLSVFGEEDKWTVELKHFVSGNQNFKVKLLESLSTEGENVQGSFAVDIKELAFDDKSLKDLKAKVSLSGNLDTPIINLSGTANKVLLSNIAIPETEFQLVTDGTESQFKIKQADQMRLDGELHKDQIKAINFDFNEFVILPESIGYLDELSLSGRGEIKGQEGSGDLVLSSRHFAGESALRGQFSLKQGDLKVNFLNPSKSIQARFDFNINQIGQGALELILDDFEPSEYNPDLECFQIDLIAKYQFRTEQPKQGNGLVDLNKLMLGCAPHTVQLKQTEQIKILNGEIANLNIAMQSPESEINLEGSVDLTKGLNLTAKTNVKLPALIAFLPWLDDLRGKLQADLKLSGPFENLEFDGQAELSNAEFVVASAGLSASDLNAKLKLSRHQVMIESFEGKLNDSPIYVYGEVNPWEVEQSNLDFGYQDLAFEPDDNIYLNTSANLNLSANEENQLTLTGELLINEAIFRKNLGFQEILQMISEQYVPSDQNTFFSRMPDLKLKINLNAKRNIFIISNLLESEMNANLDINGSLQEPVISGELSSLYGWFGLRNSKFNLSNAKVVFLPHNFEPNIQILAETNVINRLGEPVYIILEAEGSLSDPRINLIADSNLSEQEIITLLTTRGQYRARTQASQLASSELNVGDDSNEQHGIFSKLFNKLTKLDSLTLEPAFNNRTGLIEPSIIAEKQLANDLRLTSESFIGSSQTGARFSANYDLTPYLTVAGIADTVTTQENTALGFDASFTLLAPKKSFLSVKLIGDSPVSKEEILKNLRLGPDSQIKIFDLGEVKDSLISWMKSQGYFDAKADLSCEAVSNFCRLLEINLDAGNLYTIEEVTFLNDALPEHISINPIEAGEQAATVDFKNRLFKQTIQALRSEGYLKARVKIDYLMKEDAVALAIDLQLGQPVSFVFQGNNAFSAEELLKTINIYKRKQPFGNNTINILLQNIEKHYRKAGYLLATFSYEKTLDQDRHRLTYFVTVNEEQQLKEINVEIQGLNSTELEQLKELIEADDPNMLRVIFNPGHVLEEELEANLFYLKSIYENQGHQDTEIIYQLVPKDEGETVDIIYTFKTNEAFSFKKVQVQGFPVGTEQPALMEPPYSIPRINRYVDIVLDKLEKNGFMEPSVTTDFLDTHSLALKVKISDVIKIKSLSCEGNQLISCETILESIDIKAGDQFRKSEISQARGKLLKLGLFQQVQILPQDGGLDSAEEDLIIFVAERPLVTANVGIGINSELGLHLFGEAVDRSLFKDGKRISLRLDTYYDDTSADITQGIAGLRFRNPNFFRTGAKFTKDFSFQKFENPTLEYDLDRLILDTSLQKIWANGIGLTFGHSGLYEDLENVTPDAVLSEFDQGNLQLSYLYG